MATTPKPPTPPKNTGVMGLASATPATTPTAPRPALQLPNVHLQRTDPTQDLRGATISRGNAPDREQLAQQYTDNWIKQSEPYYQRDLRSAVRAGGGAGQLGSGQLRTSLGDMALNRGIQSDAMRSNFLTQALEGTIGDQFRDVGIAQQQQGFQSGLQNQTFNQDLARTQLGLSENPYGAQLNAANQQGARANAAGQSLMDLINGVTGSNAAAATNHTLEDLLNRIGSGGGGELLPVGTPVSDFPIYG